MVYLPPYRHELRGVVKPFVDVLTARHDRQVHKRFQNTMGELETLLAAGDIPRENPKAVYLTTVEKCRESPTEVSDRELAKAIATTTVATKTDVLGLLYQHTGRTAEDDFDQYFTPPNAAAAVATMGETARRHFDPPTPSTETVSGGTTLSMFGDNDADETTDSGGERDCTVFFDPACGSGRLLLAAARRCSGSPVALGWDIDRDAARMAALTLTLVEIPGWVVGGDATQLATRELYRIAPDTDTPLQCFRSFSPADAAAIPSSRPDDPRPYDPYPTLQEPVSDADTVINEIGNTLEAGIDQTVGNPPFNKCDLEKPHPTGNKEFTEYETGRSPIGPNGSLRSSQKFEWLFTELALEFTKTDGDVSLIVPTSMLANPSDSDEREWLLDVAHYEAGGELPPETFAPETTTGTSIISFIPKPEANTGLQINHEIFMAVAERIGHDNQATRKALVEDGEPVELATADLPTYFLSHRWRGIEQIRVPDDDLLKLVSEHRKMRADDGTDTTPIGDHVPFARDTPTGKPTAPDSPTRNSRESAEG